jgi:hypothetical protein
MTRADKSRSPSTQRKKTKVGHAHSTTQIGMLKPSVQPKKTWACPQRKAKMNVQALPPKESNKLGHARSTNKCCLNVEALPPRERKETLGMQGAQFLKTNILKPFHSNK